MQFNFNQVIFYFSSTGNSLSIATELADELNDFTCHITQASKYKVRDNERIGFVYPTHNQDMPNLMKKFVEEFEFGKNHYLYGIFTHGGDKGNSLFSLKEILFNKGLTLNYGNDILMPVNSRIMYGMVTTDIEKRVNGQNSAVQNIAWDLLNGVENAHLIKRKRSAAVMQSISNTPFIKKYFTPKVNTDKCTACGICVQVCPVQNIGITNTKAFIESNCENCLTCVHWCPHQAINMGNRSVKEKQQYHHPDIKLSQIISQV